MKKKEKKFMGIFVIVLAIAMIGLYFFGIPIFSVVSFPPINMNQVTSFNFICDFTTCISSGIQSGDTTTFYGQWGTVGVKFPIGTATLHSFSGVLQSYLPSYIPTQSGTFVIFATTTHGYISYTEQTTVNVVGTCTSVCSSGQTKCENTHYYTCQMSANTGCYVWVDNGIQPQCQPSPQCPTCPQPGEWSTCTGQQSRTNYKCDSTTNYQCSPTTETRPCTPPIPDCPYQCCNTGEGYTPTVCVSGTCTNHECVNPCVSTGFICNDWTTCDATTHQQNHTCIDNCQATKIEYKNCNVVCIPPPKPCDNAILNTITCIWDTSQCNNGTIKTCYDLGYLNTQVSGKTCISISTVYGLCYSCSENKFDILKFIIDNVIYISITILVVGLLSVFFILKSGKKNRKKRR